MNIVNKLTLKQLMLNRKRTLITIVGAVISTAMITAVATLGYSFMDLIKRQTIANDGEWHVMYSNVDKAQLEAVARDSETNTLIINRNAGYSLLEGSKNKNKPYLFIREFSQQGFEKFPVSLVSGRFPEKAGEIVISEAIIKNAGVNYNTGDTLTLGIGRRYLGGNEQEKMELWQDSELKREKGKVVEIFNKETEEKYTITGIIQRPEWEPAWSPGYTAISYIDEGLITPGDKVDAIVILKNVNNKLFEHAAAFAKANNISKYGYNNELLRAYGVIKDDDLRKVLINLCAIIMVIIMAGSISLIYNAFAISVAERSRHLGMLSSVGATKTQKRNSVFFEGFIIAIVSIPVGILAGLAGIGITFSLINPAMQSAFGISQSFELAVYPTTIIIAAAVSTVTIFISTYIPARKASRFSAIDAIRQASDLKLTGRAVKTSFLTRKVFGIEGELGLKNLKRNKGRYKATVFSLIISMVLFLAVSSFTLEMKKSITLSRDGINFDISVYSSDKSIRQEEIFQKIAHLDDVTEAVQLTSLDATTWIDEENMADYLKGKGLELRDGKIQYQVIINALDDEALKAYAKETGVDFGSLKDTDSISAVVVDTVQYQDTKAGMFVEAKAIKANKGDRLEITFFNIESDRDVPIAPIEIAALTDKLPMGAGHRGASSLINIVVSMDTLDKIAEANENVRQYINSRLLIKSSNPLKLQESIENMSDPEAANSIHVFNLYLQRQRDEQMILLMSVFGYGFILLITAICIANIFNTISTSIALRKREFAMLKSVGMTPAGFGRMINYESVFYGLKALLYGIPLSFGVMYLIHTALGETFAYAFIIPWVNVIISVVSVFVIVGIAMLYSSSKVKKENIIDALKREII